MQGPFTEQHVGGYQYRHTGLNIGLATTRQEGWYTTTTEVLGDTYFIVYNPSAIATGYPRAGYSRDHIAKSYVNIKNIKTIYLIFLLPSYFWMSISLYGNCI